MSIFFAFAIAMITGIFYFAGLWLTVKQVTKISKPYLWLIISFLVRLIIILIVFYFLLRANTFNIFPCLIGFLLIRFISIKIVSQKSILIDQ